MRRQHGELSYLEKTHFLIFKIWHSRGSCCFGGHKNKLVLIAQVKKFFFHSNYLSDNTITEKFMLNPITWLVPWQANWFLSYNACPKISLNNSVLLHGNIPWRLLVPSRLLNKWRKLSLSNITTVFQTSLARKVDQCSFLCLFLTEEDMPNYLWFWEIIQSKFHPVAIGVFCCCCFFSQKNDLPDLVSVVKFSLANEQWPNCRN